MNRLHTLPLLALSAVVGLQSVTTAQDERFPLGSAIEEGISPQGLQALDELVQGFVDDGEVVGAELLVVKNDRTLLHTAHGWRDRDAELPMEPGSVFCVRSMTKPLIGVATRMLIEDDALELDDRVAAYLPAFEREGLRDITIEQLLTHTSGLPMSLIMAQDPRALESVRAVADRAGEATLEFAPGTDFQYSDQGTDTLTAVIEVVTGLPAEHFLAERVFAPLGMRESTCHMMLDHPLRERGCAKYVGGPGMWSPFWSPTETPLFGCFLGSQGLYSTTTDYARFLSLFLDRGRADGERLLRMRSVRATLQQGPHPFDGSSGFSGLQAQYGSMMVLWIPSDADADADPLVFGHSGSDGTYAWAFPEEDALVLYFTQSRGTPTGLRVEEHLADLFLGVPFDPLELAPPLEQYIGYYREDEDDLYRAIILDGDQLALEVLGRAVATLVYIGEDRWKLRDEPGVVLEFERDEAGAVVSYAIGDHREFRFRPSVDLPSAEELAERVRTAHGLERLEELGVLHMSGSITMVRLDREGRTESWAAWPDRWRAEEVLGDIHGRMAYDGTDVRSSTGDEAVATLEGLAAELNRDASVLARFGDWRRWYPHLEVVQHLGEGQNEAYLLRTGDCSGPATTLYVQAESGMLGGVDRMGWIEGAGRMGQKLRFGDVREVHGMQLPYRTQITFANTLVGEVVVELDAIEVGVDVPDGWFALQDDAPVEDGGSPGDPSVGDGSAGR